MWKNYRVCFAVFWLLGHISLAEAVSDAPLRTLNAYIEGNSDCSEQLADWNRKYGPKAVAGEMSREFYYRVLGFLYWGKCGRPFVKDILGELRKVWTIYSKGLVSEAEFEAKEAELINLFFAALRDEAHGQEMVNAYVGRITTWLINLDAPKQYYNCTYFGDQPRCLD